MGKKRHFIHAIFLGLVSACTLIGASAGTAVPVFAEDSAGTSTLSSEKSNLTIEYFDDIEAQTIPVKDAEFKIYQVAYVGTNGLTDNGAFLPLDDSIDYNKSEFKKEDASTDAYKYEDAVIEAYTKNPKLGYTGSTTIDSTGRSTFKDIPAGAYLVTETKTPRYHIRSIPFIVMTPEMTSGSDGWNTDVKCSPKAMTAGDLTIRKVLKGTGPSTKDVFHFVLHLPAGTYRTTLADGSVASVTDGTTVTLKGGQTVAIYDLPAGGKYSVEEKEANQNGYKTVYKNASGEITAKSETGVTVYNSKDKPNVSTFVKDNPVIVAELFGFAVCALVVILIAKKKSRNEEER